MAKIQSSLSFLDRLEKAIFSRFNPNHVPATGSAILMAFIASMVLSLVIFVCQMCNVSDRTTEIIAAIGLVAIAGWVVYTCLPAAKSFNGWGLTLGYLAYALLLTAVAFYLAIWTTMLAILALAIYGVVKIFFPSSKSKKIKIRYSDGTEEEAEEEIGLLGEKTYTGKTTNQTFDEYEINNLKS